MKKYVESLLFVALSATALTGQAAVSAEEAKVLGTTLTAFGAEKAGNKDGTIPEYTGAVVKPPAGYDAVNNPGNRPDPYKDEKPLFTITAQNAAQYADKLDGWIQVFKIYPNYRMDIYPTHRNATFPKFVLDNSIKNATSCKGTDSSELRLEGCYGGFPFPIPKTGAQAMWNHLLAYQTTSEESQNYTWVVPPTSSPVLSAGTHVFEEWPYYDPKRTTTNGPKDLFWKVRSDMISPARKVGEKIVLLDYVDSIASRRAYSYIPGQRRVKLAPDLSYDTPGPWQGGYATMDEGKVFLGPIDRYNWKLIGKKEKFIEYNNYKACNAPTEKVLSTKNFPNPDYSRWELHRVWVVEGTLKPEYRHIYKKRIVYWDEDGSLAGLGENYDAGGKLFRLGANYFQTYFNGEGMANNATYYLELNSGGYATAGLGGGLPRSGWWQGTKKDEFFFSPEALAAEGIR